MWVDQAGVFHSVALPCPGELMTPQFQSCLDTLLQSGEDFEGFIERAQDEFFERYDDWRYDEAVEAEFEAIAPPRDILSGRFQSVGGLRTIIEEIPPRWRLDAVMAIEAYVDFSK